MSVVSLSLEKVPQVEESPVMLRVDVQCFPVVALGLLWVTCECSQVVHGAGMTRI